MDRAPARAMGSGGRFKEGVIPSGTQGARRPLRARMGMAPPP
ncbi:hypothetical protein HMPREF1864_01063 [Peptoniphilus sp. DNF00840]|nr:hypothetical protein HMPREF1864_01063 [Peptoniphilus sp. DNF00840]